MKAFKKTLTILLSVLILVLSVPMVSLASYDDEVYVFMGESETYTADNNSDAAISLFSSFSRGYGEISGVLGDQLSDYAGDLYEEIVDYYVKGKNVDNYVFKKGNEVLIELETEATKTVNSDSSISIVLSQEDKNLLSVAVFAITGAAHDAMFRDYPELFWLRSFNQSYSYGISYDRNDLNNAGDEPFPVTVKISAIAYKPVAIYGDPAAEMAEVYYAIDSVVADMNAHFTEKGEEATREYKLRYIHDYICNNSAYAEAALEEEIETGVSNHIMRSIQPFFTGDKLHVCEGYAKTFKVLCDRFDIPCILVSGSTRDKYYPDDSALDGAHMWNYVQLEDGEWYLVDVTWDDQKSMIYDTYFLAGQDSVSFYADYPDSKVDIIDEERYERYTFSSMTINKEVIVGKVFSYPELHCGHSKGTYSKTTEATCIKDGKIADICEVCEKTVSSVAIKAEGHSFGETVAAVTATCTTKGNEAYKSCTECDMYFAADEDEFSAASNSKISAFDTEIDENNHDFTDEFTVDAEPTCENPGSKSKHCSRCAATSDVTEIPALGHTYDNTCDTDCNTCGETRIIEHTYDNNCDTDCNVCGEERMITHAYTSVVTEPTCTAEGYTTYTCACGYTYVDNYTEVLDHEYASEITTPSTHLTEGVKTYTCKCGDTYTESVAKLTEHTYTSVVTKEATHLEYGETTYTCKCGDTYTEAIEKLAGHTYTSVVTEPTCTAEGYTTYTCACGDTYVDNYTEVLDHEYTSEITTPSTHLTEGVKTYTCKCGDTYTESVAKLTKHTYTSVITKEATHLNEGEATYTCECGNTYTEAIGKLAGHTYTSVVTEPTCTAEGYTTYTCECGDSYKADKIAAFGHTFSEWSETKAPTCSNKGEQQRECSVCKTVETRMVATVAHNYNTTVVNPTCTTDGQTIYTCVECEYSYSEKIKATGHSDKNGDLVCDNCDEEFDPTENCSCNCHKGGFSGFIWKIVRFFYKLFGMNKTCSCGVAHY